MDDYEGDRPLGCGMVVALMIGTIGTLAVVGWLAFSLAIGAWNLVFGYKDEANFDAETVEMEIHDKPLFTLEQQRELVQDHSTMVKIGGECVVFELSGEFPEELKLYMWGYSE